MIEGQKTGARAEGQGTEGRMMEGREGGGGRVRRDGRWRDGRREGRGTKDRTMGDVETSHRRTWGEGTGQSMEKRLIEGQRHRDGGKG